MFFDVVDIQRVLDIAHHSGLVATRAQFGILIDCEIHGRLAGEEPFGHGGGRADVDLHRQHGEGVEQATHRGDDLLDLGGRGGVDDDPVVDRIDPQTRVALQAESAGQKGFGDLFLEVPHLLAAWLEALLVFQFRGAYLDELIDDGGRQQLFLGAKGAQDLTADRVGEADVAFARGDPARGHRCRGTRGHKGFLG